MFVNSCFFCKANALLLASPVLYDIQVAISAAGESELNQADR